MISRKTLFSILLGVAGVLILTWKMTVLPARVVIINQSGVGIAGVALTSESGRKEIGVLDNGATRAVSLNPSSTLRLTYRSGSKTRVWSSPKAVTAGQSVVLYVTPERVEVRDRIGRLQR